MNKILIKYSELTLKGKNRKEFANQLVKNIKNKFKEKNIEIKIDKYFDKLILNSNNDVEELILILKKIIGISWLAEIIEFKIENKEEIYEQLSLILNNKDNFSFRVSAKTIDKNIFSSSDELTRFVATYILKNFNSKVKLKDYDIEIHLRIDEKLNATLYKEKIRGLEGLPSGSNGEALSLLSGGIDSPVSSFEVLKRGFNTSFITFLTPVTKTENVVTKINSLAKKVNSFNGSNRKLFLVNFKIIQAMISEVGFEEYRTIILRIFFMKFAKFVSEKYKFDLLVTGDSIGQVASQTPKAMEVIDKNSEMLIIRPLVTANKNEIISKAKEIGTYEISILPGDDMCSLFSPKNPTTKPKKETVEKILEKLKDIDKYFENILDKHTEIINLGEK